MSAAIAPGGIDLEVDRPPAVDATRVYRELQHAAAQYSMRADTPRQRLVPRPDGALAHVAYVVVRADVGGGARIVFEHANRLHARGIRTTIVSHWPRPTWHDIAGDWIQISFAVNLPDAIPSCDVIVATYWSLVAGCVGAGIAPVVHFEQGDFHLFDELDTALEDMVRANVGAAPYTITLTDHVATILRDRYRVDADVVPNAVDRARFHPSDADAPRPAGRPRIMLMGSDHVAFKGTRDVLHALDLLQAQGRALDIVWVSPLPLAAPRGEVHVAPRQDELASLYRSADVFVSGSKYETFPLPPLEAMASGTPVVSTDNDGVLAYAVDGVNCLLAPVGDAAALAQQIGRVLDDALLAERLRSGGLDTVARYDWDRIIDQIVTELAGAARHRPADRNRPRTWRTSLPAGHFVAGDGATRLDRGLASSPADEIAIPMVFDALDGHRVARWQVVARRRTSTGAGCQRLHLPFVPDSPVIPYADALSCLARGDAERALARFMRHFDAAPDPAQRAAISRWIALSLIECGRDDEAERILGEGIDAHPHLTDLAYLLAVVRGLRHGDDRVTRELLSAVVAIGDAAGYPEFFYELREIAGRRLAAMDGAGP